MTRPKHRPEEDVAKWRLEADRLEGEHRKARDKAMQLARAKKPLTLSAHTGDDDTKAKLGEMNREILAANLEADDLGEAVRQARIKLAEAENIVRVAEREAGLRKASKIADERVKVAGQIEQHAEALGQALEKWRQLGREIMEATGWDDTLQQRVYATLRLEAAVGWHAGWLFDEEYGRRRREQIIGEGSLADAEASALATIMLTEKGIKQKAQHAAKPIVVSDEAEAA